MTSGSTRGAALLTCQTFTLGLISAFLVIPANAIFLAEYGSSWLPVTYIAVALLGAVASSAIAQAVRRWPLANVATVTLAVFAVVFFSSWALLVTVHAVWVSAVLLAMFPIVIQLGFVFVGGQAGHILDLAEIKQAFPRIVSGFAVGFAIGGLLGVPLIALLGDTEDLLLATTTTAIAFLMFIRITTSRHRSTLTEVVASDEAPVRPPMRQLLTTRFVILVFAYQVLSAMGTQVLEFLVFDRAAARYGSTDDLARFVRAVHGDPQHRRHRLPRDHCRAAHETVRSAPRADRQSRRCHGAHRRRCSSRRSVRVWRRWRCCTSLARLGIADISLSTGRHGRRSPRRTR